jgi:hypothetical protein
MLTDRSPGHRDTWAFLDRRLADVATFGRSVGEGISVGQAVMGGLASIAGAGIDLLRPAMLQGLDLGAALTALQGLAGLAAPRASAPSAGGAASPAPAGEYTAAGRPATGDYGSASDEFATHAGPAGTARVLPGSSIDEAAFGERSGRTQGTLQAANPLAAAGAIAATAAAAAQGMAQTAASSVAAVAAAAGIRLPGTPAGAGVATSTHTFDRAAYERSRRGGGSGAGSTTGAAPGSAPLQ